ncbi:putative DNA primase/helicase [Fulvimarina manganoxydans]|uniref:Putative DNA primase/helicase n=1 Tax=Fulvimarina manganoxydans TaxID=937218 RepID=A0A1W2EKC1_9HYPH|nr:phage/plasmid primase, P4 family [Fulvimarina manganoxydans]SMD10160.1 putative DNA primase/helicase [Fulvimarina manganoxydans]
MPEVIEFTGGRRPVSGKPGKEADKREVQLALKPLTDLGNVERFVARYGETFRWCLELGWLAWDGRRWVIEDAETRAMLAIYDTVRAIQTEGFALAASPEDFEVQPATRGKEAVFLSEKVKQWGRSSESKGHIEALVKLSCRKLSIRPDMLDADPMLFNVRNGTLVFRRPEDCPDGEDLVTIKPHDAGDLITKLAPVDFDPDAGRPVFDGFFERVQPDAAHRRYLAQWCGYSALGNADEHKIAFFYGKGRNGKSTFTDAVSFVFGDYSDTVPIETFLDQGAKRKGGDATPELADLRRVRMLLTSEPEKGAKLAEAKIKLVTGGEVVKVRHLNKDFFRLKPEFTVTMAGNYRPEITGSDDGIKARVDLVPWSVHIPREERDKRLAKKLEAEASGILNFVLDGVRDYLENGLVTPASILEATEQYFADSDPLGRFLELCVRSHDGSRVQSSELHRLHSAWAKAAGENEWSNKGFTKAMKERGWRSKQSNNVYWLDMVTVKTVGDFIDADGNVRKGEGDEYEPGYAG